MASNTRTLECPTFATKIVEVKSIHLLPDRSNIEKSDALSQTRESDHALTLIQFPPT